MTSKWQCSWPQSPFSLLLLVIFPSFKGFQHLSQHTIHGKCSVHAREWTKKKKKLSGIGSMDRKCKARRSVVGYEDPYCGRPPRPGRLQTPRGPGPSLCSTPGPPGILTSLTHPPHHPGPQLPFSTQWGNWMRWFLKSLLPIVFQNLRN